MLEKISQSAVVSGLNKIISKVFLRNSQIVRTKTAYNNGKLYYKEWSIEEHASSKTKYFRSYLDNKVIKSSQKRVDFEA